jgi:hypothetical protein
VCGNSARTDLCGGRLEMGVPTANSKISALKQLDFFAAEICCIMVA